MQFYVAEATMAARQRLIDAELRRLDGACISARARTPVTPGGRFARRLDHEVLAYHQLELRMSKIIKLKATARGRAGKGAARAVRREGLIPGVVYGDKKEPQNISFAYNELQPHVNAGRFMSTLVDLEVDGTVVRAIPRDIQFEPVRDFISHVDFLRLGKGARIHVEVPVHFKNHAESPGIKKGGVLNIVR